MDGWTDRLVLDSPQMPQRQKNNETGRLNDEFKALTHIIAAVILSFTLNKSETQCSPVVYLILTQCSPVVYLTFT